MGNVVDTTSDERTPLKHLCDTHPENAKSFRLLSGALNKKLGSAVWPIGGASQLEIVKKAQEIIWTKSQNKEAKLLIQKWREYCQEKRDKEILSSWQDNAVKLGIKLIDGGNPKTTEILRKEVGEEKRRRAARKPDTKTSVKNKFESSSPEVIELRNSMDGIGLEGDDDSIWEEGLLYPPLNTHAVDGHVAASPPVVGHLPHTGPPSDSQSGIQDLAQGPCAPALATPSPIPSPFLFRYRDLYWRPSYKNQEQNSHEQTPRATSRLCPSKNQQVQKQHSRR